MPTTPIRVLLVDDTQVDLVIIKRMLAASPEIQVVGTAQNGREALELIPLLQPTIICTDYHMPVMDGLELTKEVMKRYPCPILVITSASISDGTIFPLLEAGALDVFPKPGNIFEADQAAFELIRKIRLLSGVFVFRKRGEQPTAYVSAPPQSVRPLLNRPASISIVAVGASTGGPHALQAIFPHLPSDFPVPVVCVQHICEGFLQGFVEWLGLQCRMTVKIARSGETPQAGTIYFPKEGTHLIVDDRGRLMASQELPLDGHRPSVTATFTSVARYYGKNACGVLLTGMGRDGADGMLAIARAGGITIAQDEESCVVFGMPGEAIKLGAIQSILPLREVAPVLIDLMKNTH
jgi:two-component system chemotaxis response regulator CheB